MVRWGIIKKATLLDPIKEMTHTEGGGTTQKFLAIYWWTWKNKKCQKNEKMPGDIIILEMRTKNCDHIVYSSWNMVHKGWRDRQTDRQKKDI